MYKDSETFNTPILSGFAARFTIPLFHHLNILPYSTIPVWVSWQGGRLACDGEDSSNEHRAEGISDFKCIEGPMIVYVEFQKFPRAVQKSSS
jgi:hypothetical protein